MKKALLLGIAAAILGACAQVDTNDKDHQWVERTYRTGSNLPTKHSPAADGVTTTSAEDVDKMRNSSLNVPQSFNLPGGSK
jgi:hypothetical protein